MRLISGIVSFAILRAGLAQRASISDASDIVRSVNALECRSNVTVCAEYCKKNMKKSCLDGSFIMANGGNCTGPGGSCKCIYPSKCPQI
ncbi:hypothetical protein V2G26_004900 [Clonostachys chloroleuca]